MSPTATEDQLEKFQTSNTSKTPYKVLRQLKIKAAPSSVEKDAISAEKINTIIFDLMTKYAATQNKKYALATYKHLCMVSDQHSINPELQFMNQSLALKWHAIYRKAALHK